MYPMLTKKLYFEGGGEPFLTFMKFQKNIFYGNFIYFYSYFFSIEIFNTNFLKIKTHCR